MLDVDGDIDAGREVEFLELVDGLGGGLHDVDEALVGAHGCPAFYRRTLMRPQV